MAKVKVIPCLDMKGGKVVKGIQFEKLVVAGDVAELAAYYSEQGADELVFLDISATNEDREPTHEVISRAAGSSTIPLTVGGGMRDIEDIKAVIALGVTKISLNTAAVENPDLIDEAVELLGSENVVVAIDASANEEEEGHWDVLTRGGMRNTGLDVKAWAREAVRRGAGALLVTSKDRDGERSGFDIPLTKMVSSAVDVPVIASGGAGAIAHFVEAALEGGAQGVLAASVFHFKTISIAEVKKALAEAGLEVD